MQTYVYIISNQLRTIIYIEDCATYRHYGWGLPNLNLDFKIADQPSIDSNASAGKPFHLYKYKGPSVENGYPMRKMRIPHWIYLEHGNKEGWRSKAEKQIQE